MEFSTTNLLITRQMKLEVFTEVLNRLRKQSDKEHALYALDVDLINYSDGYTSIIDILLNVYYGKEGSDWIDWYLWEREPDGDEYQAMDKDGNPICYDDISLWEEVERCRLENKEEYNLPVRLTDEEREEILNMIAKGFS
jgi:hypothetical protein